MAKKKRPQEAPPPVEEAAIAVAQPVVQLDWWSEDPRREQALDMILDGMSKSQVAKQLNVHRNTVNNWCADARFVAEANARMNEHKAGKRIRRLRVTNLINDKIEKVTLSLVNKIETNVIDASTGKARDNIPDSTGKIMSMFRQFAYEFREMRGQERIDYGDDVKKVAINSHQTITGDVAVHHTGVNEIPFADYVRKSINSKQMNVEAIEIDDGVGGSQLLLKTAEHLLTDTDLLEEINAEDKLEEEESK